MPTVARNDLPRAAVEERLDAGQALSAGRLVPDVARWPRALQFDARDPPGALNDGRISEIEERRDRARIEHRRQAPGELTGDQAQAQLHGDRPGTPAKLLDRQRPVGRLPDPEDKIGRHRHGHPRNRLHRLAAPLQPLGPQKSPGQWLVDPSAEIPPARRGRKAAEERPVPGLDGLTMNHEPRRRETELDRERQIGMGVPSRVRRDAHGAERTDVEQPGRVRRVDVCQPRHPYVASIHRGHIQNRRHAQRPEREVPCDLIARPIGERHDQAVRGARLAVERQRVEPEGLCIEGQAEPPLSARSGDRRREQRSDRGLDIVEEKTGAGRPPPLEAQRLRRRPPVVPGEAQHHRVGRLARARPPVHLPLDLHAFVAGQAGLVECCPGQASLVQVLGHRPVVEQPLVHELRGFDLQDGRRGVPGDCPGPEVGGVSHRVHGPGGEPRRPLCVPDQLRDRPGAGIRGKARLGDAVDGQFDLRPLIDRDGHGRLRDRGLDRVAGVHREVMHAHVHLRRGVVDTKWLAELGRVAQRVERLDDQAPGPVGRAERVEQPDPVPRCGGVEQRDGPRRGGLESDDDAPESRGVVRVDRHEHGPSEPFGARVAFDAREHGRVDHGPHLVVGQRRLVCIEERRRIGGDLVLEGGGHALDAHTGSVGLGVVEPERAGAGELPAECVRRQVEAGRTVASVEHTIAGEIGPVERHEVEGCERRRGLGPQARRQLAGLSAETGQREQVAVGVGRRHVGRLVRIRRAQRGRLSNSEVGAEARGRFVPGLGERLELAAARPGPRDGQIGERTDRALPPRQLGLERRHEGLQARLRPPGQVLVGHRLVSILAGAIGAACRAEQQWPGVFWQHELEAAVGVGERDGQRCPRLGLRVDGQRGDLDPDRRPLEDAAPEHPARQIVDGERAAHGRLGAVPIDRDELEDDGRLDQASGVQGGLQNIGRGLFVDQGRCRGDRGLCPRERERLHPRLGVSCRDAHSHDARQGCVFSGFEPFDGGRGGVAQGRRPAARKRVTRRALQTFHQLAHVPRLELRPLRGAEDIAHGERQLGSQGLGGEPVGARADGQRDGTRGPEAIHQRIMPRVLDEPREEPLRREGPRPRANGARRSHGKAVEGVLEERGAPVAGRRPQRVEPKVTLHRVEPGRDRGTISPGACRAHERRGPGRVSVHPDVELCAMVEGWQPRGEGGGVPATGGRQLIAPGLDGEVQREPALPVGQGRAQARTIARLGPQLDRGACSRARQDDDPCHLLFEQRRAGFAAGTGAGRRHRDPDPTPSCARLHSSELSVPAGRASTESRPVGAACDRGQTGRGQRGQRGGPTGRPRPFSNLRAAMAARTSACAKPAAAFICCPLAALTSRLVTVPAW